MKTDDNIERPFLALVFAAMAAIRHRFIRRIRGQQLGEAAQPNWRQSGQQATSPGDDDPTVSSTTRGHSKKSNQSQSFLRDKLEDFIARESASAVDDKVVYRERRAGWEDMVERDLLRRLWVYFQPYRWQIGLLFVHILIAVAVGVLNPWLAKVILDAGVLPGDTTVVFLCVGGLLISSLFASLNMRAYSRRTYAVSHRVIHDFRRDCNDAIERLHPLQFMEVEAQQVATLTQENVASVLQLLSNNVLRTVVGVAVSFVFLIVLLVIDWRIAALGIAALPINMVLQIRYRWRFRRTWHRVNEYYYHIKDLVTERVEHHEVFRAFGVHKAAADRTDAFIYENRNTSVARDWISADWHFFVELTGHLCNVGIFALTGWLAARGEISPGMFMMLVFIAAQLYRPILDAYGVLMNIQGALSRVSDTLEFVGREKETVHTPLVPERHPKILKGQIELVDVNFSYVPGRMVLANVDMCIHPGDHIGLIGRTGSGKTTLARLISREYEPDDGTIRFDGYDYQDLDIDWFRTTQLAVVLQDAHIINSRIGHVIRMGKPQASIDEVIAAAKLADAHDFINKLPDGYNTMVGPHGMKLSGGERQRLAIARAALRNPRILILDEATSNLDNITETRIQRALERLMADRTTLAISHRWTTLRQCSRIYCVLDNGQVAPVGAYDDLVAQAQAQGEQLYDHLSQVYTKASVNQ